MGLRLGYLGGRADSRGLAYQSQGFCKWLQPERILGIDMTTDNLSPYPNDWSVFDGNALTVVRPADLTEDFIRAWAQDIDVVLGAETFYKDEVIDWLRAMGIPTVLQINAEFAPWWGAGPNDPKPDVLIVPTTWRMELMPGVVHLPFPVDRELFPFRQRDQAKRFIHIAGHRAMGDRAGTQLVLGLAQRMRNRQAYQNIDLIIRSQSPMEFGRGMRTEGFIDTETYSDPRDLYTDIDVMVLPRRYGGNSLVFNEALSSGIPIIALDRVPERDWGGVLPLPARAKGRIPTKGGMIELYNANPAHLLQTMQRLADNPHEVAEASCAADAYASTISWDVMLPRWQDFLREVVG